MFSFHEGFRQHRRCSSQKIFPGTLKFLNGRIIEISENKRFYNRFIIPGFVNYHVHIENSMLVPSEFSRIAVIHITLATVSDPHEISYVLGVNGVRFMIRNGQRVPPSSSPLAHRHAFPRHPSKQREH